MFRLSILLLFMCSCQNINSNSEERDTSLLLGGEEQNDSSSDPSELLEIENSDSLVFNQSAKDSLISFSLNALELLGLDNSTQKFAIVFDEWNQAHHGDTVEVKFQNDSVVVKWIGIGNLTLVEKGEIMEAGILRRHQSGAWIIASENKEIYQEEIGGCYGPPMIIELEKKVVHIC